jgi:hypothetical protein
MQNTLQTFVAGLVAIGMITALTLPGRQTPQVLKAAGGVLQGGLKTAISGK